MDREFSSAATHLTLMPIPLKGLASDKIPERRPATPDSSRFGLQPGEKPAFT